LIIVAVAELDPLFFSLANQKDNDMNPRKQHRANRKGQNEFW